MYLFGTFLIFFLGNLAAQVENMFALCLFISTSYLGLYAGFRLGAFSSLIPFQENQIHDFGKFRIDNYIVLMGSAYLLIWGLNQIYEFGGINFSDLVKSITSPGESYKAKFEVYEMRLLTNRVSVVNQVLILLSVIYALTIPLGVASWRNMKTYIRMLFLVCIAAYVLSFLFIGTMKGIGDVFLFVIAGAGVALAKKSLTSQAVTSRWKIRTIVTVLAVTIFTYMASNQIDRAEQFGITSARSVGNTSDTLISKTFGEKVAFGVYSVLAYPSHGYLGLSYSLQQPFEFSRGAGFSQAMESYRLQYLGGEDNRYKTYPHRSEAVTGWPAGMYWSTIFPWLASDLTFYLIPPFMAVLGFIFARVWIACVFNRSILALAAFGQFVIFVAFVPANNQILMQRQGLWVVITLLALWVFNNLLSQPRVNHV